ncbi:hypothetical protein HMPREF0971_01655 [Segatella oris F0302]|uniref:Uncharacterized protein n=1 Tax=Segatella oris F0302 TaxID=649760 RepID=D1QRP8_9BACT|nr:hypothetical protein HMPREF0971_01655 [Segatella oris F0302]
MSKLNNIINHSLLQCSLKRQHLRFILFYISGQARTNAVLNSLCLFFATSSRLLLPIT